MIFIAFIATFFAAWIVVPILFGLMRFFCLYTTVEECRCKVYMLFGKVIGVIDEPGLHFLFSRFGPKALIMQIFGEVYELDLRLDQQYLRSQAVNSEEGTPIGIGIWYEMRISNPVEFIFRNTDPRGSLRANVSNATVRCLSNMPLENLMQDRHAMSRMVRAEVSPKSEAWGYRLGSVYIRKVHFSDDHMIRQIELKVVNRLRQVTSAIRQVGANQVDIIKSAAEREAAKEFAHAAAMRPYLVGMALQDISKDREIMDAVFEILETQKMLEGEVDLTLIPGAEHAGLLSNLLASRGERQHAGVRDAQGGPPPETERPPLYQAPYQPFQQGG